MWAWHAICFMDLSGSIWNLVLQSLKTSYLHYHNVYHCVKSMQIRRFFWSVFSHIRTKYGVNLRSPYSVQIWENMDQEKLRVWTLFTQCIATKLQTVCLLTLKGSKTSTLIMWFCKVTWKTTRYGRMVTGFNELQTIKSRDPSITLFCEITWGTKTIISLIP